MVYSKRLLPRRGATGLVGTGRTGRHGMVWLAVLAPLVPYSQVDLFPCCASAQPRERELRADSFFLPGRVHPRMVVCVDVREVCVLLENRIGGPFACVWRSADFGSNFSFRTYKRRFVWVLILHRNLFFRTHVRRIPDFHAYRRQNE